MNILITNDDGILAEGIEVLARGAAAFGKVTVVAPADQCSAMSHQITLRRDLVMQKVDFPVAGVDAYSVDGTPADCVKAAMDALPGYRPDLLLSGINNGYNVGYDIAYSGTVGAAMEGLMYGIASVALSRHHVGDFGVTEAYLSRVLKAILAQPPLRREVWNVNFPTGKCNGILWDRVCAPEGYYEGNVDVTRQDGKMILHYPPMKELDAACPKGPADSDLYAVQKGYISIGKVPCPVL